MHEKNTTIQNLRLEVAVKALARCLQMEPASSSPMVLVEVIGDGYRQHIVGRASDLVATKAWLKERGALPNC